MSDSIILHPTECYCHVTPQNFEAQLCLEYAAENGFFVATNSRVCDYCKKRRTIYSRTSKPVPQEYLK